MGTVLLFPVGVLARRIGRPLPDPRVWFGEYVVRSPAGTFSCPSAPAPFFLGAGSRYDAALVAEIEKLDGGVFVDAGASVGFITVRAARRASRVVAIEPHPVRFAYLQRNVQLNGLLNVTCVNCALGAAEGTVGLYDVDPTLGPHPLDVSTHPGRGRRFEVPVRRLDDVVDQEAAFIKIDVERDELNVLNGARRLLSTHPTLVVECLDERQLTQLVSELGDYCFEKIDGTNYLGKPSAGAGASKKAPSGVEPL